MDRADASPRLLLVCNQVRDFLEYRMVLARALRADGFEVHVAAPPEPGREAIERDGMRVHLVPFRRLSARPWTEARTLAALLRLYRRLRPALVHHFGLKPTLYGATAARLAGVPAVVNTLTGMGPLFTMRTATMRALRQAAGHALRFGLRHPRTAVVVQNPDDRDLLVARGIATPEQIVLIPGSGVDLAVFRPAPEPAGPPVVLMASRLLWEKGVEEFVEAARRLRARGVSARFVLVGEPEAGHPTAVPRAALERWRDAGIVELPGWRRDVPALLAESHIVCLPSFYGEGIPRILIEAAACGRPIVTTDSPGCREAARDGRSGLLVPPRDAGALAAALAALLEDAPRRAAMGAAGRALAARFSIERVIEANLDLHRRLRERAGSPR